MGTKSQETKIASVSCHWELRDQEKEVDVTSPEKKFSIFLDRF